MAPPGFKNGRVQSLDDFFQREGAGSAEEGTFTLNSQALRRKLLHSLPPGGDQLGRATSHLRTALSLAGAEVDRNGSLTRAVLRGYLPLLYDGELPRPFIDLERVRRAVERPFESTELLDLELARGLLWLAGLGHTLSWEQGGVRLVIQPDGTVTESRKGRRDRLRVVSLDGPVYKRYPNSTERLRGFGRETVPDYRPGSSLLAVTPPKKGYRHTHYQSVCMEARLEELGWFQYRVKPVALFERLVLAERPIERPLLVNWSGGREPFREKLYRLLVGASSFSVLQGEVPLSGPQPQTGRGQFFYQQSLTSQPGTALLSNGGTLVEGNLNLDVPPGATVLAVWPEARTDVWGEGFVEDEGLEKAREWMNAEIRSCRRAVAERLERLIDQVRAGYCGRAYGDEVANKMRELWGQAPS